MVTNTEKVDIPESKGLDFKVEALYEESGESEDIEKEIPLDKFQF